MDAGGWTRAVLALAGYLAVLSCGSDVAAPTAGDVKEITITPASDTLEVGGTSTLRATVHGASGDTLAGRTLFWNSEDSSVATVSDQGVVTAVAQGTARIAASAEGVSGIATVRVTPKSVRSIVISPSSVTLRTGQSAQLRARMYDRNGKELTGRTVSWSSDNDAIALVDNSGQVTALLPGTATITATSEGVNATARVTVALPPVANVAVDPGSVTLIVGQTAQLTATLTDSDGKTLTGRSISWSSSRSQVAAVSSAGLVTAAAPGSATITATSEGKSGSSTITVKDPEPPDEPSGLEISPDDVTLKSGDKVKLSVKAEGDKKNKKLKVTWSTSNSLIARVDDDGTVTAFLPGTATITARTSDGRSGTAKVSVVRR
jgi:uncharacterized protein YjdB